MGSARATRRSARCAWSASDGWKIDEPLVGLEPAAFPAFPDQQ